MTDAQFARSPGRVLHRDAMTTALFRDVEPLMDVAPTTDTEPDRHHLDWNPQSASVSVSGQGS